MNDEPAGQERTAAPAANQAVSAALCLPESPACWHQVQQTLELIANKWAVPLLLALYAASPVRYAGLQEKLDGISAKELARQLKLLEAAGLVLRTVHPAKPPAVEYALTALGRSLQPVLAMLAHWSVLHGADVRANAEAHAHAAAPVPGTLVHRIR